MTSAVNRIAAVWSEPDRAVHLLVDGVALVDTIAPGTGAVVELRT